MPDCIHTSEVRARKDSLGRILYVPQCTACGQVLGSAIAHAKVANPEACLPFDEALQNRASRVDFSQRRELSDLERGQRLADWRAEHDEYLKSDKWQIIRKRVMERDCRTCKACGVRPATDVHHMTYKHWKNEPLFDLVAVCRPCHLSLHEDHRL